MATTIVQGDILSVKYCLYYGDQLGIMIQHYRCSGVAGGGLTDEEIARELNKQAFALLGPMTTTTTEYVGCYVQKIVPLPLAPTVSSGQFGGFGAVASGVAPTQLSGLIQLKTAGAGRKNRGRKYMPFPYAGAVGPNGTVTLGYGSELLSLGSQLFASLVNCTVSGRTVGLNPVIYHRKTQTVIDVSGVQVSAGWATQRRRGSHGRPNARPTL